MALQLFDVLGGFSIDELAQHIAGTGVPGSGTNDGIAQTALEGALYQRTGSGNISFYQKVTSGSTTADWIKLATVQDIEDSLSVIEWQDSALNYVIDNTVAPATEVQGDRYILSHDGGAPHADYDGASAGDIVEFNGTVWVATTPTTGTFISADDENTLVYYWGGASWTPKYFEATTASTGLTLVGNDVQLASSAAGDGLAFTAGVLSVNVDDSTIEIVTDTLQVKADGINDTHIDFGLGANQVNAADLPYDNTTSGLTATQTQAAIDELDERLDVLEAQEDLLNNTAATPVTADSVLVDEVAAITWHLMLEDTTTGDREYMQISALHDGSKDGVTDATEAEYQVYAKTRSGNVAGDIITVDVNGTGGAQTMRLRVTATNIFDTRVIKSEVIYF